MLNRKQMKKMMGMLALSAVLCAGNGNCVAYAAEKTAVSSEPVNGVVYAGAQNETAFVGPVKYIGSDAEDEAAEEEEKEEIPEALYTGAQFKSMGVTNYNGYRFTWYSERALPGTGLKIPGRHADEQGFICDEDDFICVASRDFEKGAEVDTPFGKKGKVYDYCPGSGTIDIYVNW